MHGVLVGFGQLSDQLLHRVHSLFVVRTFWGRDRELLPHKRAPPCGNKQVASLTDGVDKVVEEPIREERLWKLPEEHL